MREVIYFWPLGSIGAICRLRGSRNIRLVTSTFFQMVTFAVFQGRVVFFFPPPSCLLVLIGYRSGPVVCFRIFSLIFLLFVPFLVPLFCKGKDQPTKKHQEA